MNVGQSLLGHLVARTQGFCAELGTRLQLGGENSSKTSAFRAKALRWEVSRMHDYDKISCDSPSLSLDFLCDITSNGRSVPA
jgi:hypothetical protein